jgi:O-antigen/teichoic acid export membrane protein
MSSATKKVAYNTAIQVAGKGIVMVLAAVSVAILTRYLGPSGYGNFTLALVYLTFFGIMADLGLFTIAVREMSKDKSRMQEILGNTLSLRALLSIVVFSVAIGIAWLLPYEVDVKVAIAIAAVSQFFGLLNSSIITVFQTELRMDRSVISDIVGRSLALAAVLFVIWQDWGFYAIVATAAVGSLATFLVSIFLSRRWVNFAFYYNPKLWKELMKESLPLGAALVVSNFYFRVDVLLLSFLASSAAVGIYGAVFKIFELLMTVPQFFQNSTFPILVKRLHKGTADSDAFMQKAFDAMLIAGAAFAFGGLLIAPDIMRVIGGPEFVSGADALRVTLFAMSFSFTIIMFSSLYVAMGRQIAALKIGLFGLVANVLLNLIFIPMFGIVGAALSTLITEACILGLYLRGAKGTLGVKVSLHAVPRVLLAGVLTVAAMWPLREHFIIAFLVGGTVYVAAVFALRLVKRDILAELRPGR